MSILKNQQEIGGDAAQQRADEPASTLAVKKPKKRRETNLAESAAPWKQMQKGNPGDDFQPEPWTPMPAKRRG
jgi:NADH dehydrogenase [ubiquinone] 1 alpha subcomplex assembly factor 2